MDAILYQSILEGSVEKALHRTCECLLDQKCTAMEETWIRLVSLIGEKICHNSHAILFYLLIHELYVVIHKESLSVREALQFTSKLILSCKRDFVQVSVSSTIRPRKTIQKLRSNIIDYFPNDAQLTNAGRNKYSKLLPVEPEERAFAERILVGLLHIYDKNCKEDMREALEYLCRKRITLYSVPAPHNVRIQKDDREDLVPYIWIILKYIRPLSYYKKLEELYYYQYKPSYKSSRLGFLLALSYMDESCATSTIPVWSQTEYNLLQRVSEFSLEMWKEVKESRLQCTGFKSEPVKPNTSAFENFMPRVSTPSRIDIYQNIESETEKEDTKKTINIRKKRFKKTEALSAKKSEQKTDSIPENETSNNYSRGGRFDFSQTWPGIQNRIPPKGN